MTTPPPLKICCYPSVIRSMWSRNSVVAIGTARCSILGRGRFFSSPKRPHRLCDPPRALLQCVLRPLYEGKAADECNYLTSISAEVKMGWAIPFHSRCLRSLDKEAFIIQWNFLGQTATLRWEGHTAHSRTPSYQFWFYQTTSTPWRWGQS